MKYVGAAIGVGAVAYYTTRKQNTVIDPHYNFEQQSIEIDVILFCLWFVFMTSWIMDSKILISQLSMLELLQR